MECLNESMATWLVIMRRLTEDRLLKFEHTVFVDSRERRIWNILVGTSTAATRFIIYLL